MNILNDFSSLYPENRELTYIGYKTQLEELRKYSVLDILKTLIFYTYSNVLRQYVTLTKK